MTSLATLLATVVLCSCGDDTQTVVIENNDNSVEGTVAAGVISVPVSIDGTAAQPFVIDTGAVFTRLDPNRYRALALTPGLGQVSTLDVGSVHLTDVGVYTAELCNEMTMCRGTEPAGLLGGTVLAGFVFTIDYQARTVTFGAFTPPDDVGAPVEVPFALEGGGDRVIEGEPVTLAPTRISVQVDIEGTLMPMLVDTGSSTMVLKADVYDALVADGRSQSSISLGTVMGTQSVPITTIRSVTLGSETQTDVEAVRAPLDIGLLENELGHPIAGLLGGRYLENYVTTIDYPGRVITLRAYSY
jgi:hypothetical protein